MSDEQRRAARPWVKVAAGLVLGLLVGAALWLTVPREPVFNAVGLDPLGCEEAVSAYERDMDHYTRRAWDYKHLLPDSQEEAIERKFRPAREQREHNQRVEEAFSEAFNSIERAALVAEQNPDCFSPEQRAEAEQLYRASQRARGD